MNSQKTTVHYGKTHITRLLSWGVNTRNGHRLLCPDGVVRAAELAETADTFFSTPARVRINGKSVSGYATVNTEDGSSIEHGQKLAWTFHPHADRGIASWTPETLAQHVNAHGGLRTISY